MFLSIQGTKNTMNLIQKQSNTCGFILTFCLVISWFLLSVTMMIANLVTSIQALVVGVPTYRNSEQSCENYIGTWLVVFGSIGLGMIGMNLLSEACLKPIDEEKSAPRPSCFGFLLQLISLGQLGWICYGLSIVYGGNTLQYQNCSPSQYHVFWLIVMLMFWGYIASISLSVIMLFYFFCFMAPKKEVLREKPNLNFGAANFGGLTLV